MTIRKVNQEQNKAAGDLYVDVANSKLYTAFLDKRDDASLTQLLTGSGVGDMTKAVYDTGTVNADAFTMTNFSGGNWKLPYTDGSGDIAELALGAATKVLTSGGASAAPTWEDAAGAVDSVFTRTGAVVAAINDYTWAQIDKTTSDIADITTKSHTSLSDIGTNTHAQIDTFIGTTVAATYLKLDCSNDPLTATLQTSTRIDIDSTSEYLLVEAW